MFVVPHGWPHKFFGFPSWTRQMPSCFNQEVLQQYCRFDISRSRVGQFIMKSVYTWVSEWHICISQVPTWTHSYATRIHELKRNKLNKMCTRTNTSHRAMTVFWLALTLGKLLACQSKCCQYLVQCNQTIADYITEEFIIFIKFYGGSKYFF